MTDELMTSKRIDKIIKAVSEMGDLSLNLGAGKELFDIGEQAKLTPEYKDKMDALYKLVMEFPERPMGNRTSFTEGYATGFNACLAELYAEFKKIMEQKP